MAQETVSKELSCNSDWTKLLDSVDTFLIDCDGNMICLFTQAYKIVADSDCVINVLILSARCICNMAKIYMAH